MYQSKISFHSNIVPDGQILFEEDLFNRSLHLSLQSQLGWIKYYALDSDQNILIRFNIHLENGEANSPFRSPYGGVEFVQSLSPDQLKSFMDFVESDLQSRGVESLTIKLPPAGYDERRFSILNDVLFRNGFSVITSELDALLSVNEVEFQNKIISSKRNKLNQCRTVGLDFSQTSINKYDEVYDFIEANYLNRGYTLSMSKEALRKTIDAFPEAYHLFEVKDGKELVAASISIRINSKVLYSFYSVTQLSYDRCSPSVFLYEGIYKFCRSQKAQCLDYGTSALEGKPNLGLLKFKEEIGGQLNLKLTFSKRFD